jgi:hypothetical protein
MLIIRKILVLGYVYVDKTRSTYQEPKIGVLKCEKLGLKPNWRFYEYFKILKPKLGVLWKKIKVGTMIKKNSWKVRTNQH